MYKTHLHHCIANNRNILSIALDVHMTNNGSLDRSNQSQTQDVNLLKDVIENWEKSDIEFDLKVKELLEIVINEYTFRNRELHSNLIQ